MKNNFYWLRTREKKSGIVSLSAPAAAWKDITITGEWLIGKGVHPISNESTIEY